MFKMTRQGAAPVASLPVAVVLLQQNTATKNIDILDIIHEPYVKLQRWILLLQSKRRSVEKYEQKFLPCNT